MTEDEIRKEFEAWIVKPPFELDVARFPDDSAQYAWPGSYKDYEVSLAWEAYRAGRNAALDAAARRAEIVRDVDIPTAIRALKEQSNES